MLTVIPEETQVILIGASCFPNDEKLCPLPGVVNNVNDLALLFQDPQLIGIPESNITTILNEEYESTVTKLVQKIKLATDTLIVYYAGHGLIGRSGIAKTELLLAVTSTTLNESAVNAIRYSVVRSEIEGSPAKKKILILDSCFSGRALPKMSASADDWKNRIDIKGAYTITSVPKNEQADAPEGERYTAFSGALINSIQNGIKNRKPYINIEDLYQDVRTQLLNSGYLEPQRGLVHNADKIDLLRNRSFEPEVEPNSIYICDDGLSTTRKLINLAKDCLQENGSEKWHVISREDISFSRSPEISLSEEIINKSERIIAIVGSFYGIQYPDRDISCLEYELKKVGELNFPTLIFFVSEQCESEDNIQNLVPFDMSMHARARRLTSLMQRQEKVKEYLTSNQPIFEIIEIDNSDQLTDCLSDWVKELIETKHRPSDTVIQTNIVPLSTAGFFVPSYDHLEYDRRPVNYSIEDLDSEIIDFLLDQPEAVTKLRDAGLLRSSNSKKLSHLGFFHDDYPSLGSLLCFAPQQLLSNQYDSCKVHMVKYAGPERGSSRILKQQNISGNLLNLYDSAMDFLENNLNNTGKIGTDERDDLEIPRLALREAIANAIVHRDYGSSDFSNQPTRIEIYTNRVEITSFGSLPRGVSPSDLNDNPEDIIPFRRNPVIAEIFRIMQRVELNASGISRIHLASKRANLSSPIIREINEAFVKIALFRPSPQIIQAVTGESNQVIGEVVQDVFGGQNIQVNNTSVPVIQKCRRCQRNY